MMCFAYFLGSSGEYNRTSSLEMFSGKQSHDVRPDNVIKHTIARAALVENQDRYPMIEKTDSRMCVLLLDSDTTSKHCLCDWLDDNGFVTWHANDVRHALEELTDFTVRRRPDIVLLEVSSLPERFETLQSMIRSSSRSDDVGVVGFSDGESSPPRENFFARDLDQLKSLICQQLKPSSAFHAQRG